MLAGQGQVITDRQVCIGELTAWASHRSRRVATRTATKNQLLGQLDRALPGLTLALPDVLGTKIGRLVAAEFSPLTAARTTPDDPPRSNKSTWARQLTSSLPGNTHRTDQTQTPAITGVANPCAHPQP